MERISNNYHDFRDELKVELSTLNLDKNELCIVIYSEVPWFEGGQFSLSLIQNTHTNIYTLIEKTWDNEFDHKRFSTGVFNLDRLCIRTRHIEIPVSKQHECNWLKA